MDSDLEAAEPAGDLYRSYETWKGWDDPFTFSRDEAAYFRGECRGFAIANAEVFEIGFGSGSFIAWARESGARVAGCEINKAALEAASSRGVELLPADFERVAASYGARFDTVVAFDVFEHFSLSEIARRLEALETMLKPGGHLLMRFPNAQSPFGLAPQNGDPTHKTALSRNVFQLLLQKRAFRIVRYAPSFRIGGGGFARSIVRPIRHALRSAVSGLLNFVYATSIPYDPVVVIVLLRLRAPQAAAPQEHRVSP